MKYQHGDSLASSTDVLGATAGIQAAWHFRADRSIDPRVSLGTGWNGLWLNPSSGKVTSLQGFELARLQIGADHRLSKDIAIAPVIGGRLSLFVSRDSPMTTDDDRRLPTTPRSKDKQINAIGFARLSGRFDLGGSRR